MRITKVAQQACEDTLEDHPDMIDAAMAPIRSCVAAHLLAFRDRYADLSQLMSLSNGKPVPPWMLDVLCNTLLAFETAVGRYTLSKRREALGALFRDLEELAQAGQPLVARMIANMPDFAILAEAGVPKGAVAEKHEPEAKPGLKNESDQG